MKRTGLTLIDVVVSILVITLFAGITVGQLSRAKETANRVRCASNLRQIGQALLLYSNENRNAFPRTMVDGGADGNPKPMWGTPYERDKELGAGGDKAGDKANSFVTEKKNNIKFTPAPNDVTAALFLLMRTQDIAAEVFICPTTNRTQWDFEGGTNTALNWTNWKGNAGIRDHLSYSYQNPYSSKDAIVKGFKFTNSAPADFAVASDMNPGVEVLLKLNVNSSPEQMRAGNSLNHRGDGQNVLFGDCHVEFAQWPFVGIQRDNIFTFGETGTHHPDKAGDGIVGSSVDAFDSILLPTAKDVGATDVTKPEELLKALTADETKDLQTKMRGKYARNHARLMITDDELTAKSGPTTVTYQYKIGGMLDGKIILVLTAPDTKSEEIWLDLKSTEITFWSTRAVGNRAFDGPWKPER